MKTKNTICLWLSDARAISTSGLEVMLNHQALGLFQAARPLSPGGQILMIAPVSPRRLTKLSLECAIEGRFGLVSYIGGDVRDAPRCLFEGSCGNLKSPTRQVRHRRL